jgi:hypothetical protein
MIRIAALNLRSGVYLQLGERVQLRRATRILLITRILIQADDPVLCMPKYHEQKMQPDPCDMCCYQHLLG